MASRISWRSIRRFPYAVVAATIGRGFDLQAKRVGRSNAGWGRGLTAARQHCQDHIATSDAGLQRFRTGGLDRGQAVIEHRAEHLDELSTKSPLGKSASHFR